MIISLLIPLILGASSDLSNLMNEEEQIFNPPMKLQNVAWSFCLNSHPNLNVKDHSKLITFKPLFIYTHPIYEIDRMKCLHTALVKDLSSKMK